MFVLSFGVQLLFCIPAFAEMIIKTPQGVSIKVDDRPLLELISEIENKTGFRIKAPDSMKEEKIMELTFSMKVIPCSVIHIN